VNAGTSTSAKTVVTVRAFVNAVADAFAIAFGNAFVSAFVNAFVNGFVNGFVNALGNAFVNAFDAHRPTRVVIGEPLIRAFDTLALIRLPPCG
jgi:hypothetical protein